MLAPAAIYASFNWNDPVAMKGWAIPSATDIALGRFEGHNTDFFLTPAYPPEKHVLCPRNAGIHEFPGSRRDILIRMNQHIKPAA
jgi:hypothetical protein